MSGPEPAALSAPVPDVAAERVAAWQEVDPHHVVSTGERVRCERNDTTDLAVEFTVAEELDGEHIESLFHPVDPRKRYYTVRAAALTTEQSAALAGTDEAGQS